LRALLNRAEEVFKVVVIVFTEITALNKESAEEVIRISILLGLQGTKTDSWNRNTVYIKRDKE
jgi:hypothetical protein